MRALPNMKAIGEPQKFFWDSNKHPLNVTAAYALLLTKIFCSKYIKEKDISINGIDETINRLEEMYRKAITLRFGLNGGLPKSYRAIAEHLKVSAWKARKYVLATLQKLRDIECVCNYSKRLECLEKRNALSYDPSSGIKILLFLGLIKKATINALGKNKICFVGQLAANSEQHILDLADLSKDEKVDALACKVILAMLTADYKYDFYDKINYAYRVGKITYKSCNVLEAINITTLGLLDRTEEELILGIESISDEEKAQIINFKAELKGKLQEFSYVPIETIKRACLAHKITGKTLYYLKKLGIKTLDDLIKTSDDQIKRLKYSYSGIQEILKFKQQVLNKIVR